MRHTPSAALQHAYLARAMRPTAVKTYSLIDVSNLSNDALVEAFNKEVGLTCWSEARGYYIQALRNEFLLRHIDFSSIGDKRALDLTRKVYLEEGKLHRLEDLTD